MVALFTRLFVVLLISLLVAGYRHFNLPSKNTIVVDSLVYVVENMDYKSSSSFYVSYSSTSEKSAHQQALIINNFLLKTERNFLFRIEDVSSFGDRPREKRKFTLLLVDSIEAFGRLMPVLRAREYATSGKHLVFISTKLEENETMNLIQQIFDVFFRHYIVNVGVILKNGTTGLMNFYTYFPVSPSYCFKVIPVLQSAFNVRRRSSGTLNLFPPKFNNFFGCPLKVVTFPFPPHVFLRHDKDGVKATGIDIKVLYGIADKLNFSVVIIDAKERGFQQADGTLTGALKLLYESEANITLGGFGSASKAMVLFSASIAYLNAAMIFAIPPLQEYSPLERLLLPLQSHVWLAIGLTFGMTFLTSVALSAWSRSYRNLVFGSTVRYPVLEMVKVYLGGSVARFPQEGISRNLILQWLIVSMVLSSCYNAVLFGMLKRGFLKKFPTTVEGMLDDGFVIDVSVNLLQNLKDGPLGGRDASFHLLKYSIHTHYAILQTGKSKRMVIDTNIQLEHFNSIYYEDGILNSLPQRLFIFPMYIYCRKDSFLVDPIDDALKLFIQSGLITFWQDSVLNVSRLMHTQTSDTTNPLVVDNFMGCFALCGILIVCSIVTFLLEIVSLRINLLQKIFLSS